MLRLQGQLDERYTHWSEGSLQETGTPLDVATDEWPTGFRQVFDILDQLSAQFADGDNWFELRRGERQFRLLQRRLRPFVFGSLAVAQAAQERIDHRSEFRSQPTFKLVTGKIQPIQPYHLSYFRRNRTTWKDKTNSKMPITAANTAVTGTIMLRPS